jgi:TonB family protein
MSRVLSIAGAALMALGAPFLLVANVAPNAAWAQSVAPALTKPPTLVTFVEAPYPEAEKAKATEGTTVTVGLKLLIRADGTVGDVTVAASGGLAFDEAAVAAARRFVFTPAEVDGAPAAIRILYNYAFTLAVTKPTIASLAGVVRDGATKAPRAGVKVRVESKSLKAPREVVTLADGAFLFEDLPASPVTVALSGKGLTPVRTQEQLEGGVRLETVYEINAPPPQATSNDDTDDIEIVVRPSQLLKQVASTEVRVEEAKKVPGISGDVVRVVEALPGVARATVGSGNLVIWGASPTESKVFVDGVPVPRLYHEGGWRTVVQPELVQSIEFVPGGQGAGWGRMTGGVIAVNTDVPATRTVQGSVTADVLDASGMVSVDLTGGWRAAGSVRASYYDQWAARILAESDRAFAPFAQYRDGQLRLRYTIANREFVELAGMIGFDSFSRGVPNADPALASLDSRSLGFQRGWIRYVREGDNGEAVRIVAFAGADQSRRNERLGVVDGLLENDIVLGGLRASYRTRLAPWLSAETGLDAEIRNNSLNQRGSLGLPSRELDIRLFGQPAPDAVAADTWTVAELNIAPYGQLEFRPLGDKLSIIPGLRIDPNLRNISARLPPNPNTPSQGRFEQNASFEPRLAIRYQPLPWLGVRAAGGLYHQQPQASDLSAVFGSPNLPVSKSWHAVAGLDLTIAQFVTVELTGFYRTTADIAVRARTDAPSAALALWPSGEGRSYGGQVLFRQKAWKGFTWWLAYTLTWAERRYTDLDEWFPYDLDQRHALSALISYELPEGWSVGGRVRLASGYPRTVAVGAYYDTLRDRSQPVYGPQNGDRLPLFIQGDVRIAKEFRWGRHTLSAYLEVLNVWNQRNAEEFVYAPDYSRRATITSLPILPVLGVQWTF